MMLLLCNTAISFSENCPMYDDLFNGNWIASFSEWIMQSAYTQTITADGFHSLTVVNNKILICEYQNNIEIKNYVNAEMKFKEIQGNNWTVSADNTVFKCISDNPVDCSFTVSRD